MKIGIDCRMYSSSFTGIGRYTKELIDNLAALDKKNHYVLFFNDPTFSSFTLPNKRFSKVLVNCSHYSFKEQYVFLKKLNAAKLDLMHFTHFNAPLFYSGKSIVTIHDLTLSYFPGKKMSGFFYRLAYQLVLNSIAKKSAVILADSQNTKNDIIKLLKIRPTKIEVAYPGVGSEFHKIKDEQILLNVKNKYQLPDKFLLYTGVWRSHKNLVGLIKAFSILKNKFNYPGKLVITGNADPLYSEVIDTARDLNLSGEIVFIGLVPDQDLIPLINLAEIYVFPSFYEGFGLPILEAFACDVPVAAAKTSCIPEVCGEESVVFFDPCDPNDIAEKISKIFSTPDLKEKLILAGKKVLKKYSWEKMARKIMKIYQLLNV